MNIAIKLQHGLYNAGVLGFYNILQHANKSHYVNYKKGSNIIYIDEKCLDGFEEDYYNYLAFKYEKQLKINTIISKFELFNFNNLDEELFSEWLELIKSKLDSASYKSGYTIIKNYRNDDTNIENILKKLKKTKLIEEKIQYSKEIYNYLKKHIDVFIYKDLAYLIIDNYWKGISFYGSQNVKKEMKEEYKREFVEGAKAVYENITNTNKNSCNLCHTNVIKKKVGRTEILSNVSTWLIDQGVDFKRKSSYYWNFKPSEEICGLCKLIYSCIPAGFYNYYRNGMFINMSSSFDDLIRFNNPDGNEMASEGYEAHQDKSYGYIINTMAAGIDKVSTDMSINNIQIIKRDNCFSDEPKYHIEYLGQYELKVLKQTIQFLSYYKLKKPKVRDEYKNVYTEIMHNITNNQNQYNLINELLLSSLKEKSYLKLLNLIKIQAIQSINRKVNGGADKDMIEKKLNKINVAYYKGAELRSALEGNDEEKDNKLRGFIYQLTNALQANNTSIFMDRIVRLYSSLKISIPSLFIDTLKDEDDFMNYGYAFIIGLKGENIKKEEE